MKNDIFVQTFLARIKKYLDFNIISVCEEKIFGFSSYKNGYLYNLIFFYLLKKKFF